MEEELKRIHDDTVLYHNVYQDQNYRLCGDGTIRVEGVLGGRKYYTVKCGPLQKHDTIAQDCDGAVALLEKLMRSRRVSNDLKFVSLERLDPMYMSLVEVDEIYRLAAKRCLKSETGSFRDVDWKAIYEEKKAELGLLKCQAAEKENAKRTSVEVEAE